MTTDFDKKDRDNDNFPEPPVRWKPDSPHPIESGQEGEDRLPKGGLPENTPMAEGESPADGRTAEIGSTRFQLKGDEIPAFESARRLVTISQIIAVISLFFGGVLLSSAAVACAAYAFSRLNRIAAAHEENPLMQAVLRRSGILAIIVSAAALIFNAVTLALFYPTLAGVMQSGDLSSLFGGGSSAGTGTGNSTWG